MGQKVESKGSGSSVKRAADYLEHLVFNEYEPGDSLPGEGDIAETLQISRLTVREAMREVAARGLVDIHNGRRPVVSSLNGREVGSFFRSAVRRDSRAALDLLEIRHALEVQIASLAAQNASRAQIAQMVETVDAMAGSVEDAEAFNREDLKFHGLLADATGNRMMALLMQELSDALSASRRLSASGHARRGLTLGPVLEQHRAILTAVQLGDQRAARAAMRKHLRATRADLEAFD
jgi:GntR family transcriptional repressor for pyruvate dehydrogenase complex